MTYNNDEKYLIIACRNCRINNRVITRKAALAVCGNCRWTLLPYNVKISNKQNIEASNYLMRMLIELIGKLRSLRRNLECELIDIDDAERRLTACESLTELLYGHASQHDIHLQNYSEHLLVIVSISQDITDEISGRKHLAKRNSGRWKKPLNAVIKVTNFVFLLLGLPTFLHPLPEDKRLLKSATYYQLYP